LNRKGPHHEKRGNLFYRINYRREDNISAQREIHDKEVGKIEAIARECQATFTMGGSNIISGNGDGYLLVLWLV
jgi:hypothetical protein